MHCLGIWQNVGFECLCGEVNLWMTIIVISLSFYVLGHTQRIIPLLDENLLIISRFAVDSLLIPHYASSQV